MLLSIYLLTSDPCAFGICVLRPQGCAVCGLFKCCNYYNYRETFSPRGPGLDVTLLFCPAGVRGVESRECLCVPLCSLRDSVLDKKYRIQKISLLGKVVEAGLLFFLDV